MEAKRPGYVDREHWRRFRVHGNTGQIEEDVGEGKDEYSEDRKEEAGTNKDELHDSHRLRKLFHSADHLYPELPAPSYARALHLE